MLLVSHSMEDIAKYADKVLVMSRKKIAMYDTVEKVFAISNTAEYGDYRTGKRLITEETSKEMKKVQTEIQDGTFASEFLTEMSPKGGRKVHFLDKRRMEAELPIEKVGAELRSMMSWLKK